MHRKAGYLVGGLIFVVTLAITLYSPIQSLSTRNTLEHIAMDQRAMTDSQLVMLELSDQLITMREAELREEYPLGYATFD